MAAHLQSLVQQASWYRVDPQPTGASRRQCTFAPFFAMTTTEWENIARCAHARYEALYHEAMETGEKTFYGHRTFITWGPLHDRAVRDLETCLMARLMASKYSNA